MPLVYHKGGKLNLVWLDGYTRLSFSGCPESVELLSVRRFFRLEKKVSFLGYFEDSGWRSCKVFGREGYGIRSLQVWNMTIMDTYAS